MAATLSALGFVEACKEFVVKYSRREAHNSTTEPSILRESYAGWTLVEHPTFPSLSYLTRTVTAFERPQPKAPGTNWEPLREMVDLEENDLEETNTPEILLSSPEQSPFTETCTGCTAIEYIVYATSYQVPAFYFTVSDSSGSPLSLGRLVQTNLFKSDALSGASVQDTHIEPRAPSRPPGQESGAVFPLLSQGDHPTLQIPCWYLHPCETGVAVGELLAVQDAAERGTPCEWLETWMAMLGTVINPRTFAAGHVPVLPS